MPLYIGKYKYLIINCAHSDSETLELNYDIETIKRLMIVRDDRNSNYLVFNSFNDFWSHNSSVVLKDRCFHEVIYGYQHQRVKFDIDITRDKLMELCDADLIRANIITAPMSESDKVDSIIVFIAGKIIDVLFVTYHSSERIVPSIRDLIIMDSSGYDRIKNTIKYSFHIIAKYAVENYHEMAELTEKLLFELPECIKLFVDGNVNKQIQNFRIIGSSSKPDSGRIKRMTSRFGSYEADKIDTLITDTKKLKLLKALGTKVRKPEHETPSVENDDIPRTLEIIKRDTNLLEAHEFRSAAGNLLIFNRLKPSVCNICNRMHDNDHTLMLRVILDDDVDEENRVRQITELCRHGLGESNLLYSCATVPGEDSHESLIVRRLNKIKEGTRNPHIALQTKFEKLPNRNVYSDDHMREYEFVETLAVKAQMKLGKTKAIKEYLAKHYPISKLYSPIIRIVTFRRTFSRAIKANFPEFHSYEEYRGSIPHNRARKLIIQVESLFKIELPSGVAESVDLLILDEVESILNQFNSGLHKCFNNSWSIFVWMLKNAEHVICMDANISDRSYRVLEVFRPGKIFFHWNTYERASEDTFMFTDNKKAWISALYNSIKQGDKVIVPTNILKDAKVLVQLIKQERPDLKIQLYSSESSVADKNREFADVDTYWQQYDMIVYTPTLSAGVSFEIDHFNILFGYFTDGSCDVETCRQMLSRARNISKKAYCIYLHSPIYRYPTNVLAIRTLVRAKRLSLFKNISHIGVSFEYDTIGNISFYTTSYFDLWLESIRIENLSKNDFTGRFIDQVADTGAKIDPLVVDDADMQHELCAAYKGGREQLTEDECQAVALATDITTQDADDIKAKLRRVDAEISPEESCELKKFYLRETYNWHDRLISPAWVMQYQKGATRNIYKNLSIILAHNDVGEALGEVQRMERNHYTYITEAGDAELEQHDFQHRYSFQKHYLALELLRLCGFQSIRDSRELSSVLVEANIDKCKHRICYAIVNIAEEFRITIPAKLQNAVSIISVISKVLKVTYGITLDKSKTNVLISDRCTYSLNMKNINTWFRFVRPSELGILRPSDDRPTIIDSTNLAQNIEISHEDMDMFLDFVSEFETTGISDDAIDTE